MAKNASKLQWCLIRLGNDMNWWVEKISDEIRWDIDGLSILDPRQVSHILELLDPLREYGFAVDVFEAAFYRFRIEEAEKDKSVRLSRVTDSLLESEEPLFALPDVVDDERGPYADLVNHLMRLRVKMLNDLIDFEQNLTVDEIEDEIRESQNNDFMEGRATHVFSELTAILEYLPEGFELELGEDDDLPKDDDDEIEAEFPDLDDENIVEDETMKWDDGEDSDSEDGEDGEDGDEDGLGDDDEDDGDDEDDDEVPERR